MSNMGEMGDSFPQPESMRDKRTPMNVHGDPMPQMFVHDNNRGFHEPTQMKGKVFQNPEEIFNNPGKSNHGAIYDSGTYSNGVPIENDLIVSRGPFNRY